MSSPLEPISNLVATFNIRRAFALAAILAIVCFAAWTVDQYTRYSELNRLERIIALVEKIQSIDKEKRLSEETSALLDDALAKVGTLVAPDRRGDDSTAGPGLQINWSRFGSGSLPWFLFSLFALPGMIKREENSIMGFLGVQFLTIFFGLVFIVVPSAGNKAVDYLVLPWAAFMVIAGIPISVFAAKKVRESSVERAILKNLRHLSLAADQFYLENGKDKVAAADLIGEGKYIIHLTSVDGERYDELLLEQGHPIVVTRRNGSVVTHY
jgi:hypothetical protein